MPNISPNAVYVTDVMLLDGDEVEVIENLPRPHDDKVMVRRLSDGWTSAPMRSDLTRVGA